MLSVLKNIWPENPGKMQNNPRVTSGGSEQTYLQELKHRQGYNLEALIALGEMCAWLCPYSEGFSKVGQQMGTA